VPHVLTQDGLRCPLLTPRRARSRSPKTHPKDRAAPACCKFLWLDSPARRIGSRKSSIWATINCANSKVPRQGGGQGRRRRRRGVRRGLPRSSASAKIIDKVRKVYKDLEKFDEKTAKRGQSISSKRKAKTADRGGSSKICSDALQELRLNKKQIDRIVAPAQGLVSAHRNPPGAKSARSEHRVGMSERELKKTLREARRTRRWRQAIGHKAPGLARGGARGDFREHRQPHARR